jgi:hypothetical protein
MSKKIHEPGKPLKEHSKPRHPKVKTPKSQKDWFGTRNETGRLFRK